jgi:hypothetical protein
MSYFLAPDPIQSTFFIPGTNTPGNGVQLFVYTAGTTTKTTVYKDNAGVSSWSNPIVLDSGGNLLSGGVVWILGGTKIKVVWAPSNDTDPPTSPYRTIDNISGINDTSQTASQWFIGPTPTFIGATQFSLSGDQTGTFTLGRRVQAFVTAGTVYGTIITSSFGGGITTVTLVLDLGASLDAGLSAVNYGIISYSLTSAPLPNAAGDSFAAAANLDLENNYGNILTSTATVSSVTLVQGKSRTLVVSSYGLTINTTATLIPQSGRPLIAAAGDLLTFNALNGNIYVNVVRNSWPLLNISNAAITVAAGTGQFLKSAADLNDTNAYSTSSGNFTPQVPGRYLAVSGLVFSYSGVGGSAAGSLLISKNLVVVGTQEQTSAFASLGGNYSINAEALVTMNGSTDTIQVAFTNGSSTSSMSILGWGMSISKVDP